jgi:hypothetical protein
MSEAVDILHAVERLVAMANSAPAAHPAALHEVHEILLRMGLRDGAAGYKAEQLRIVLAGFETWFGTHSPAVTARDTAALRGRLLLDIEHLRKALARGSGGQD